MGYKYARGRHIAPAEVARTQAEVVLFSVALRKDVLTECSDLIEALAPDVHAEADSGWNVRGNTLICFLRQAIQ
jgi:hypothetical protein